jgi:tRNA-specific 2-thiouridylase
MIRKAMIAMSGGVDSSVAACLMKERGFDCVGVTMKLFSNEDVGIERDDACCSLKDADDARDVAYRLEIPHYVFNFSENFKREVIRRFVEAYENGDTPNPCIDCNRYIKFDRLLSRARELEYDFVVTGHYARIERDAGGRYLLKKALDGAKDQSYFLYSLTQEQLAHTSFPLGSLRKKEVREIADAHGFRNAQKRESQDICFVKDGDYVHFIEEYTGKSYEPGNFVDVSGNVLGRHRGLIRCTIGQRRGLGIASTRRLYVCDRNTADNTVTLGGEEMLYSKVLFAAGLTWTAGTAPSGAFRVRAKTGYRRPERWATVERIGDDGIRVGFDEPQRATAAGQAVVLYDGDIVIGGGTITARDKNMI